SGLTDQARYWPRDRRPGQDCGEAFLHALRFDEKGQPKSDFPTNQPAYRDAKILVTDADFGCGSSREGAAFAVMDFGLEALIGVSFAEIFQGNCMQNGIPVITLPEPAIRDIWRQLRADPGSKITIALPNQNVDPPNGAVHGFDISPLRKERLIRGIDDIDVTLEYRDAIEAFEASRSASLPWLPTACRE